MRATNAVARHKRKKRILKRTKGYWGRRHALLRLGIEAVHHADKYAYIGRKRRKRDFRSLWILRISAAARQNGIPYSRLMAGLARAKVALDRKALAETAVRDPGAFKALVEQAKAALGAMA
jgi:large subunit ribosomal protein L20